jgi:hypothetical protein
MLNFVDDMRPAPSGVDLIQQCAGRVMEPRRRGLFGLEVVAFKTRPPLQRVVVPAPASQVLIEVEIAVRQDVEARSLLVADDDCKGVLKLFSKVDVQHAGVQRTAPHADVEPSRAWKRAGYGAWKNQVGCRSKHVVLAGSVSPVSCGALPFSGLQASRETPDDEP